MKIFDDNEVQEIVKSVAAKIEKNNADKSKRKKCSNNNNSDRKNSDRKPPRPQSIEKNDDVRLSNS